MNIESIIIEIEPFLFKNNFQKIDTNVYSNDYCSIAIEEDEYAICDNEGNTYYTEDHRIYHLIGYLTYCGYMDKNYKQ